MSQEYPFPKPVNKSVLVCTDFGLYPTYQWKQAPPVGSPTYFLGSKNQVIEWRKATFTEGTQNGDLLQWDPDAGTPPDLGEWVVLSPPQNPDKPVYMYWDGDAWLFQEVKEFVICENGLPETYEIPAKKIS